MNNLQSKASDYHFAVKIHTILNLLGSLGIFYLSGAFGQENI